LTDQSFQFPRFFVTAPAPCPYLDGQEERKVFTDLSAADAQDLNDALSRVGFRRSQSVAYRPACETCNACISVRVLAQEFKPNRSMRRTMSQNRDLKVTSMDAFATPEQFELMKKYLANRHSDGGMTEMDEFEYTEMVELSPVATSVVEYREPPGEHDNLQPGKLVAAVLTDVMSDGLSMVYSFFDPESKRISLGTTMILDHIERTRKAGLPYIYLGYWVKGSPKMDYKTRFKPYEKLGPRGWESA
jgi:leucyl-tRNA---protein transferase